MKTQPLNLQGNAKSFRQYHFSVKSIIFGQRPLQSLKLPCFFFFLITNNLLAFLDHFIIPPTLFGSTCCQVTV